MARIKSEKHVEYLALEGGGGKGIAFVGAIIALQKLKVLPINIEEKNKNLLRGISGTSAGSITAFCLAIGMTGEDIVEIVENGIQYDGKTVTLDDFFDGPNVGQSRSVINGKPSSESTNYGDIIVLLNKVGFSSYKLFIKKIKDLKSLISSLLPILLGPTAMMLTQNALLRKVLPYLEHYILNLIIDKGLFPGFKIREFFTMVMNKHFVDKIKENSQNSTIPDGSILTFQQLYDYTGIEFIVAGTNISTHKPEYFSYKHTPDFPVVEAVAISMNVPFAYKPIKIEGNVNGSQDEKYNKRYQGLWMDGGTLNNLPMHAFDEYSPYKCSGDDELKPLHPGVLALRLTEPIKEPDECKGILDKLIRTGKDLDWGYSFFDFFGDFLNTVMFHYPEEGQIRTKNEREQTIEINTYCLSMMEFNPPKEKIAKPTWEAYKNIMEYFGYDPSPNKLVDYHNEDLVSYFTSKLK